MIGAFMAFLWWWGGLRPAILNTLTGLAAPGLLGALYLGARQMRAVRRELSQFERVCSGSTTFEVRPGSAGLVLHGQEAIEPPCRICIETPEFLTAKMRSFSFHLTEQRIPLIMRIEMRNEVSDVVVETSHLRRKPGDGEDEPSKLEHVWLFEHTLMPTIRLEPVVGQGNAARHSFPVRLGITTTRAWLHEFQVVDLEREQGEESRA